MNKIYLGLGSNLGNRKANIIRAVHLLSRYITLLKFSKFYETAPEGITNQPKFINAVIKAETFLSPADLLDLCQNIEKELKRTRTIRNGPRTIDIDILLYNNHVIKEQDLIVPHPRLHKRKFVLEPFLDINPNLQHPLIKKSIRELYDELPVAH